MIAPRLIYSGVQSVRSSTDLRCSFSNKQTIVVNQIGNSAFGITRPHSRQLAAGGWRCLRAARCGSSTRAITRRGFAKVHRPNTAQVFLLNYDMWVIYRDSRCGHSIDYTFHEILSSSEIAKSPLTTKQKEILKLTGVQGS